MTITLDEPFHDLTFMNPLSDARADLMVDFLTDDQPATVLDLGCGWAELLLRVLAKAPTATGIGIDTDEPSIKHGQLLADQRGLTERVTLRCDDAKTFAPASADALICIGASQIWGPPVEALEPMDYRAALNALRALLPRGGRLVYGEAIWAQPPSPEAIARLSGRLDELVPIAELVKLAVAAGFAPAAVHQANLDEWDAFESGYGACYATWLATHDPDDPDAAEVRSRAERQRQSYLEGYRSVLGMAYLHLLAV